VIGQAQIVVAGQVDDPVCRRKWQTEGLLVVEDAQLEVGAIGAQLRRRGGQVGKLGAWSGLGHGESLKEKHSAAGAGLTHRAMSGFSRRWACRKGEESEAKGPILPPITSKWIVLRQWLDAPSPDTIEF